MEPSEANGRTRFGAELRAQRTARGWTQVELGAELGYSGSYVSDAERGESGLSSDFASRCDEVFKLPGTFMRLWEDIEREVFPAWFAPVVPVEREAVTIAGWEIGSVPGLLQTEGYARALVRARHPQDGEEAVERTVRGRLDRQAILSGPDAPMSWCVLAEGVLRQAVGGPEVMGAQLDELIKAAESPGIVIQVLPYSAREHAGVSGLLYLYEYNGKPPVAYCETFGGARLIEDQQEVTDLATVMGMLRAAALPPWESVTLMRTIRRDFEQRELA